MDIENTELTIAQIKTITEAPRHQLRILWECGDSDIRVLSVGSGTVLLEMLRNYTTAYIFANSGTKSTVLCSVDVTGAATIVIRPGSIFSQFSDYLAATRSEKVLVCTERANSGIGDIARLKGSVLLYCIQGLLGEIITMKSVDLLTALMVSSPVTVDAHGDLDTGMDVWIDTTIPVPWIPNVGGSNTTKLTVFLTRKAAETTMAKHQRQVQPQYHTGHPQGHCSTL